MPPSLIRNDSRELHRDVALTPDDGGVDGGTVATGTFSAMLNVTDGGTKVLSQGSLR